MMRERRRAPRPQARPTQINLFRTGAVVLAAVGVLLGPAPLGAAPSGSTARSELRQDVRPESLQIAPEFVRAGSMIVRYWPGQARLARGVLEWARGARSLPALPDSILSDAPVRIVLAPSAARFDSVTGGRVPEWGVGVAIGNEGLIVLRTYDGRGAPSELRSVLRHELAHVALHRYLAPLRVPRWFDEGYARWAAGEWGWRSAWRLRLAFMLHETPPLDSLRLSWPVGAADAELAYLLSTSAVQYLLDYGGGVRGLRLFLARWERYGSMERALRDTYGLTTAQFEEDWREHVSDSYGWTFFVADAMTFWFLAALLLLFLFWIRRRRDREHMERLRATEPPDRPAYWAGEWEVTWDAHTPEDDSQPS